MGEVMSVSSSPDGTILASGSMDQTVRLWEVASGQLLATLNGHTDGVYSVCFNSAGTLVARGSRGHTLRLCNMTSRECQASFGHNAPVYTISMSPDGEI